MSEINRIKALEQWKNPEIRKRMIESNRQRYIDHPELKVISANNGKKGRTGKFVKCECCGKEIYKKGYRLKISEHDFCSFECKHRMQSTRNTVPEILLQQALSKEGLSFRKHEPILGQPDIFIEPNICIFVDGCYFHGCTQCCDRNKFNAVQQRDIVRDIFVTEQLKKDNYIVLRFWEHEIKKNVDVCILQVKQRIDLGV